jgi:hypothetical protein
MTRPALIAICIAGLAFGASACGSTGEDTPVACLEGSKAYLSALEDAPGLVRLPGGTRISECLAENQGGGTLATVGGAMVKSATALNAEARRSPTGPAAVQLGYLLGAAERGAEDTAGIHAELLRRLEAAAEYSPDDQPLPRPLERAYEEGFEAGETKG